MNKERWLDLLRDVATGIFLGAVLVAALSKGVAW